MEGVHQRPREGLGEQLLVNQACKGLCVPSQHGMLMAIDPELGRRVAAGRTLLRADWGE